MKYGMIIHAKRKDDIKIFILCGCLPQNANRDGIEKMKSPEKTIDILSRNTIMS
tara:strand:+ start:35536 stop:35697 length:162 start_codon:yes stop_codon:yes gene_type:complete